MVGGLTVTIYELMARKDRESIKNALLGIVPDNSIADSKLISTGIKATVAANVVALAQNLQQIGNVIQQTHYIATTDDPQTIFNSGAAGDEYVFLAGLHVHNPVNSNAILYIDKPCTITMAKNAILQIAPGSVPFISTAEIITNFSSVNITLNDLTVGGTYATTTAIAYTVQIDSVGGVDTFKWNDNYTGGTTWNAQNVPITGGLQTLDNGVQIKFNAVTGHALNSLWLVCYGVAPYYCIKVGNGLQETAIDGFKLRGEGTLDCNKNNNHGYNEYTKLLPSCVLIDGRVKNINIESITLTNGARPIQAYGENTGVYNLDGTVTGGVSYDVENINVVKIKQISCDGGSLFGFPEHRGKVKNLYFTNTYTYGMSQVIECNHMLDGYLVENNIMDANMSGIMLDLWRYSKNGKLINNTIINDILGTTVAISISSPTTWQQQTNIIQYGNTNLTTNISQGIYALCFGSPSNSVNSEGALSIGGYGNQANGLYSTITGGKNNIVSGQYSSVGGGLTNSVSGANSAVTNGTLNVITKDFSVASGNGNTVNNSYASVSGRYNTINNDYARVGGLEAVATYFGEDVFASGDFAVAGDAQISKSTQRILTSNATPAVLQFFDGSYLVVPINATWGYNITVVGRDSTGVNRGMWVGTGLISRVNNTPVIEGGTVTKTFATNASWNVEVIVSSTYNALVVRVTGIASTNIRWVVKIELTEVQF